MLYGTAAEDLGGCFKDAPNSIKGELNQKRNSTGPLVALTKTALIRRVKAGPKWSQSYCGAKRVYIEGCDYVSKYDTY